MAVYQGQQVRVIWTPLGSPPIVISDARAEGDSVDAAYDAPDRITTTAHYGRVVHSTSTNKAGSVTVTLQAVSPAAKILRQFMFAQEAAIDSGGVIPSGPLVVQAPDATGELVSLGDAVIASAPNVTLGEAAPNRAFVWRGLMSMNVVNLDG